nr:Gag-Pol polyprotein [Tanacetum cinerariifolium]
PSPLNINYKIKPYYVILMLFSSVEPKSYKEALTKYCWIEAMQEELNEFERLEVWELVPRPDHVMIITLYKVKLDELGDADHAGCQDTRRSTYESMQLLGDRLQFWYTVKKVKDTESYNFLLANKRCVVDVEVFRKILDIFPRVEGEEFTDLQDDDATLAFLIDLGYKGPLHKHPSMMEKKSRHETMPFPKFTKVIINYFLSQHKSLSKLKFQHYHTIKDDGVAIRQSKSYHMFIKYSTGKIPPKKSKSKGSQGKKTVDTTEATIDVSEESDPKPARKRIASRRVVKKKVTTIADDNINPEPDIALELGKSISLTEAAEEEVAKQVHVTHARIVTEPVPEPTRRRPSSNAFRHTSTVSKKKSSNSLQKLKGIQTLTLKEQIIADTIKALKESKNTSKRQLAIEGSSKGTGVSPGVPDEYTVVPTTSSEGTGTKPGVPDEEKTDDEETDDEFVHGKEHVQDDDEETDDEFVHDDEQVNDDEDEEMTNAKVKEFGNGDEEVTDATKKCYVKPAPEPSKIQTSTIDLEQESEKSALEIRKIKKEQVKKQKMLKYTVESTDKATLKDQEHKRQHDDDEDPSVRLNQGKKTNRRRTKESESSMKPSTTKETSKGKAPTKSSKTSKLATAHEPIEEPIAEVVMDDQETTKIKDVPWFNKMVSAAKDPLTFDELMATHIDLSKYAINRLQIDNLTQDILVALVYNLLKRTCTEFLKSSYPEKKYTTSIMKTKAARYEIVGIENMFPTLWSTTKVAYDKDAKKGFKYWGERRKLLYKSQMNKFSKHNVYSTQKILSVVCVSVKKLHGYGHLDEVVVRITDRQLYMFKEGDIVNLHLNDIKDMLLLADQHKLFQLEGSDIVDLIATLRMFTRSLIIKLRVEDLQHSVESYQKKLNITAPQKTFPEIKFKELYTPSYKPLETTRFFLGYNKEMSRRKWTVIDKRRSELMVELTDKQMRERRIIRNLERLVGARELEIDYRLMT